MDALQDATLAPFGVERCVFRGLRALVHAAHRKPLHLHDEQRVVEQGGIDAELPAQRARGKRAQQLQPALHKRRSCALAWGERLRGTVLGAGQHRRLACGQHGRLPRGLRGVELKRGPQQPRVLEALGGNPHLGVRTRCAEGTRFAPQCLEEFRPVLQRAWAPGTVRLNPGPRDGDKLQQQIVELMLVADVGPEAFADAVDGGRIEPARAFDDVVRQAAAQLHGTGAPRGEIGFIEKRIRHGIDELVRELRGHGRIHGEAGDGSALDAAQQLFEAVDVHRLSEGVAHDLANQRVIRDLDVAGHGLRTRRGMRKDAGQQIVRA